LGCERGKVTTLWSVLAVSPQVYFGVQARSKQFRPQGVSKSTGA
jgi:hypothetical protein